MLLRAGLLGRSQGASQGTTELLKCFSGYSWKAWRHMLRIVGTQMLATQGM